MIVFKWVNIYSHVSSYNMFILFEALLIAGWMNLDTARDSIGSWHKHVFMNVQIFSDLNVTHSLCKQTRWTNDTKKICG